MKPLSLLLALALATLAPRFAHADDTAALAYQQAEQLEKQGKFAEACPLYDASYRADPQIGVLLHLASCHEQIGKLASAWAEFNDAVELAHRRGDNRESLAQQRADALKPKLAYLHLAAPAAPPPGLVVMRDGLDVTVLVGTDMPIDAGEHEIRATAPGFLEFRKTITIGSLPTTTPLAIPQLEKQPAPQPPTIPIAPPKSHEGTVTIQTQADAHISLDSNEVGVGHYEGKLRAGGHELRVTAPGMRPYQTEIFVGGDETRTIDVPLEKAEVGVLAPPPVVEEQLPSFEVGLGMGPGEKLHDGNAAMLAYRLDFGFRLGRRVDFGVFADAASVSAASSCGTSIPGATGSPYDYGIHYRFNSCREYTLGLQLFIHILPKRRIDPYVGIAPGFRFGYDDVTAYQNGMPIMSATNGSQFMPGIGLEARAGVEYHPSQAMPGWAVGAFAAVRTMIIGQETFSGDDDSTPLGVRDKSDSPAVGYVDLLGGVRTSLAF